MYALEAFKPIRERAVTRKPKKGSTFLREERRWSTLRGGEVSLLKRLADEEVIGRIESIDAIFEGGINIVAVVDEGEETRLRGNPSHRVAASLREENDAIIMKS